MVEPSHFISILVQKIAVPSKYNKFAKPGLVYGNNQYWFYNSLVLPLFGHYVHQSYTILCMKHALAIVPETIFWNF